MSDKQFFKGAVCGVLCASLVLGGGYVGLQNYAKAGSGLLSDVAVKMCIRDRGSTVWPLPQQLH